jgi:hypothetical protein
VRVVAGFLAPPPSPPLLRLRAHEDVVSALETLSGWRFFVRLDGSLLSSFPIVAPSAAGAAGGLSAGAAAGDDKAAGAAIGARPAKAAVAGKKWWQF